MYRMRSYVRLWWSATWPFHLWIYDLFLSTTRSQISADNKQPVYSLIGPQPFWRILQLPRAYPIFVVKLAFVNVIFSHIYRLFSYLIFIWLRLQLRAYTYLWFEVNPWNIHGDIKLRKNASLDKNSDTPQEASCAILPAFFDPFLEPSSEFSSIFLCI